MKAMRSLWTIGMMAASVTAWALERAPLNPEFLRYQEEWQSQTPATRAADGRALGLAPAPYKFPASAWARPTIARDEARTLPARYDLRDYGKLTSVKDQGSEGNCWAFATYGSMESCLLTAATWDFSENNLANLHGFNSAYGAGGNHWMSLAYLSRWSGPVSEADDPYSNGAGGSPAGLPVRAHFQGAAFIADRASFSDNDKIKQVIVNFGAVYSTICWLEDPCFSRYTYAYYFPLANRTANHAIAIVGWDDNFDANQFPTTPPGNGAFLVRNSWGGGWGDHGYFWVSYYDTVIGKDNVLFYNVASTSNYASVYQYDNLGLCSSYGYGGTTAWGANIFSGGSGTIQAVSFYALADGAGYNIRIYTDGAAGNPVSGTLSASKNGTVMHAGYYTITLDSTVSYSTRFAVVVQFTTPGNNQPIPVEEYISGYSVAATASAGESYMSANGVSWSEAKNPYNDRYMNVCIKAFGTGGSGPVPPPPPPPVTPGSPLLADYDGDRKADPAIYRTDGIFRVRPSSIGYGYYPFSSIYGGSCIPMSGDFDGDGRADPAVVDPATSYWRFYSSRNGYARYYITKEWYFSSATHLCGDFDGDGKADPTAYFASTGDWYVMLSRNSYVTSHPLNWGGPAYTPVCGDFDGDGLDDPMLYSESSGYWFILRSRYGYSQSYIWFGGTGYTPVSGDFDGDGYADLAVYQTAAGIWHILLSSTGFDVNRHISAYWDGSAL